LGDPRLNRVYSRTKIAINAKEKFLLDVVVVVLIIGLVWTRFRSVHFAQNRRRIEVPYTVGLKTFLVLIFPGPFSGPSGALPLLGVPSFDAERLFQKVGPIVVQRQYPFDGRTKGQTPPAVRHPHDAVQENGTYRGQRKAAGYAMLAALLFRSPARGLFSTD
jgi:hypothetical protein